MLVKNAIDNLVVRPAGFDDSDERCESQLDELRLRLDEWTGHRVNVFRFVEHDIDEGLRTRDSVLRTIANEGIWLDGSPQCFQDRCVAALD
jgi:hypothetical protein